MMWNKANKIIELQEANNAYANTVNFLNEKIGELDSQMTSLRGELGMAMADLKEAQSDRDKTAQDLTDAETDLAEKEQELIDLTAGYLKLSKDHEYLANRCDVLELVLKQLHIPVTLPAKKK